MTLMKNVCFALLLVGGLIWPLAAAGQVVISTSYTSGQTIFASSTTTLSTSGTVVVNSGANVTFTAATHVTLNAGFKVATGGLFRTAVGALVDTDSDGMPDAWEVTYGLNPGVNDAAGDKDGDGLNNLLEYQLGTNPNGTNSNTADTSNTTQLKVHRPAK